MLDIVASIALTLLAVLIPFTVISASPAGRAQWRRLGIALAGWFAVVTILGAAGFFLPEGGGTPAIGLAVALPVIAGIIAFRGSAVVRALAYDVPLEWLAAVHVGRLLGVFFLLLYASGRLPPTFALTAGWGDVGVAAMALPVAWYIHRRAAGWRTATLAWNTAGLADLLLAVTLGIGSAPDSPIRFIFEVPNSGMVTSLPWLMIPAFLVPLYLLTHLAIFARLPVQGADRAVASRVPS